MWIPGSAPAIVRRHALTLVLWLGMFLSQALPARAELVFFESGRSMSVKSYRVDGDMLVLSLRGGGEVTCERRLISRVEPDEVEYRDPVGAEADAPAQFAREVPAEYEAIIDSHAAAHGVDARVVKAVIQVESGFNRRARSRRGAMGLMQLMPATARQYEVSDPYDAATNIEAGVRHLKGLLDRFPLALALAAYNAGETTVVKFRGVPPYPETRNYVAQVLRLLSR